MKWAAFIFAAGAVVFLLAKKAGALNSILGPTVTNVPFDANSAPTVTGPTAFAEQQRGVQTAGLGAGIATSVVGGFAKTGTALAKSVPIVGSVISVGLGLFQALNKPYGTCAPSAPDSPSFVKCWSHAIPNNQIPYFKGEPTSKQPGTRGWDFAFCRGATGGTHSVTPSARGCNAGDGTYGPNENPKVPCDCTSNPCVCAPAGAVMGLANGTFVDRSGNNLGPAVAKVVIQ